MRHVIDALPCRLCGSTPYVSSEFMYGRELFALLHRCESDNVPTSVEVGPCKDVESCVRAWNGLMGAEVG